MSTEAAARPAEDVPPERLGRVGLAIFALALCVRALHLWQISEAPFFGLLMGDAEGYSLWASELAGGNWLGDRVFYQAPLYPYFMGGVYSFVGESPTAVKWVQVLLGSGACVLLAHAGASFFSKLVGIVSGVALALYAPAIFFDGLIQKSALDLFLACALLAGLGSLLRVQSPARWLGVGATLGALILTRENALVLLPPILVWALLRTGGEGMRRLRPALLLVVGVAMLLLPVALRNLAVGGQLHLTTSQFGTNFYIGNGEQATGRYVPLRYGRGSWEYEREDATQLAERALGRTLTPGEVSSYWTDRALDRISSSPGEWLKLMGSKLLLLSNAAELVDTEDLYTHAEWSLALRAFRRFLHFGVVAPLALLGVIVTWSRRRELWILYALALCYAASVALFYVFARYRYPLAPMLIPLAAAGLVGLPGYWRERPGAARAGAAGAVLAAGVFCNWPVESEAVMRSATHANMAVLFQRDGQREAAREHFERAVVFDPTSVQALHGLGTALRLQGDLDAAARRYQQALARKPDYAPSHAKLGIVLALKSDHEGAISHYRRSLESDPGSALTHFQLGLSLAMLGREEDSRRHFRESIRLDPRNRTRLARTVLGTLERSEGPRERTMALRLAKLAAEPGEVGNAIVFEALAAGYAANGRLPEAVESGERAVRLAAADPEIDAAERARIAQRLERYRLGASR